MQATAKELTAAAGSITKHMEQKPEVERMLVRWMVLTFQPTSTVEHATFKDLLHCINSKIRVPSRRDIVADLLATEATAREGILRELEGQFVALTQDAWTSSAVQAFLSLTVHYMDAQFKLHSLPLECSPFPGSHTALAIAAKTEEMLSRAGISPAYVSAVVADNAANQVAAGALADFDSVACAPHTLQLTVKQILEEISVAELLTVTRSVVGSFKHSALKGAELEEEQERAGLRIRRLLQDVRTRWSSTWRHLLSLRESKRAVKVICSRYAEPEESSKQKKRRTEAVRTSGTESAGTASTASASTATTESPSTASDQSASTAITESTGPATTVSTSNSRSRSTTIVPTLTIGRTNAVTRGQSGARPALPVGALNAHDDSASEHSSDDGSVDLDVEGQRLGPGDQSDCDDLERVDIERELIAIQDSSDEHQNGSDADGSDASGNDAHEQDSDRISSDEGAEMISISNSKRTSTGGAGKSKAKATAKTASTTASSNRSNSSRNTSSNSNSNSTSATQRPRKASTKSQSTLNADSFAVGTNNSSKKGKRARKSRKTQQADGAATVTGKKRKAPSTKKQRRYMQQLSEAQWKTLDTVVDLLAPFATAQTVLEGEKYITRSALPFQISSIQQHLEKFAASEDETIKSSAELLLLDFNVRWPATWPRATRFAVALDPRTKHMKCFDKAVRKTIREELAQEMEAVFMLQYKAPGDSANTGTGTAAAEGNKAAAHAFPGNNDVNSDADLSDEETFDPSSPPDAILLLLPSRIKAELKLYNNEAQLAGDADPLLWWKERALTYPLLSPVARKWLAVPASSAASERLFSRAGLTVTDKRTRLGSELVGTLVFLNAAWPTLEAKGLVYGPLNPTTESQRKGKK